MPRGSYVPSPTDPAYYESLAAPSLLESALGGAVQGAATGFAAGSMVKAQRAQQSETARLARQLRDALVQEGVPREMAEAAALEYARKGTTELMTAYTNRQKVAADIKASGATAGKLQAETAEIAPNAAMNRAATAATTAQTQIETGLLPREMAAKETTAGASAMSAGANVTTATTGRLKVEADIERETREFVGRFDDDLSGTIDPREKPKMLTAARAKVRAEIKKIKNMDPYDLGLADAEIGAKAKWTDAEIDEEAIRVVKEQIADYEFGAQNVGRLGTEETDANVPDPAVDAWVAAMRAIPPDKHDAALERIVDATLREKVRAALGW